MFESVNAETLPSHVQLLRRCQAHQIVCFYGHLKVWILGRQNLNRGWMGVKRTKLVQWKHTFTKLKYLEHRLWLWHCVPLKDLHVALVVLHNLLRLHLLPPHGLHHQVPEGIVICLYGLKFICIYRTVLSQHYPRFHPFNYLGCRRDFMRGSMCSINSSSICLMFPLKFGFVATCRPKEHFHKDCIKQ